MALVISPTIVIEQQMQQLMSAWGTKFVHLGNVEPENLAAVIGREKPHILLSSIERLQDKTVLSALLTVKLSYVSVEEAQVNSCHQPKSLCMLYPGLGSPHRLDRVSALPRGHLAAPDHSTQLSLPLVFCYLW